MESIPNDIKLPNIPAVFETEKHVKFIKDLAANTSSYENCMTEYLRMSGVYWGLTALEIMGQSELFPIESMKEFVFECIQSDGGISPAKGHDSHMLHTLSGVQIACILGFERELPVEKIVGYVKKLQQPDGSFIGDEYGEVDTRFSFCAVAILSLLGRLDAVDLEKATEFVMKCYNFDGGFGSKPNSESHAGLIYCCVGFLSITNNISLIDVDELGHMLCERQLPCGGFNGRPGKLPDVCYSWWVLASLYMIRRSHWIDSDKLKNFIYACQDTESGGISDRPGDVADPFHTLFGVGALALMNHADMKSVDPVYCMPSDVIDRLIR